MKKQKIGLYLIASVLLWGFVLVYCAWILQGTPYKEQVNSVIGIAIILHTFIIWVPMALKNKKEENE